MLDYQRIYLKDCDCETSEYLLLKSHAECSETWLGAASAALFQIDCASSAARAHAEAIRFLRAASNKHGDATHQDARCTLDVQQIPDCPWQDSTKRKSLLNAKLKQPWFRRRPLPPIPMSTRKIQIAQTMPHWFHVTSFHIGHGPDLEQMFFRFLKNV